MLNGYHAFAIYEHRDISRSRTRCTACRSSCSAVLVATNFIAGRCTASAIASASLKSFFCPLL
jgi:hypothetical protein